MPGRVVVQWAKEDCADIGIIKVDLLGLGMMAVLEDSIRLIRDDYHEEVDLAHLPPDDPEVYATLQKADTVGMFQIESRAQMSCLPRLRPQKFYDIVVQVAIIRPGPIVGQMVNPFLQRRQGREAVTYPHPSLEPVLARTLGVPLFQEQLLRIAMISANFTGGEAEELRRAMGFKRSQARMKEIEAKLREGMTRNGIAQEAQEQIILSITSFALYGFPESHAASFALIAYASAWLKYHYLGAFTAALLNNQPMGFYHPATLVKDAQRHGLKILPIDVTKSDWKCTLETVVSRQSSVVSEEPAISHQPSAISQDPPSVTLVNRFIAGQGFDPSAETSHSTEVPWDEIGSYGRSKHGTNLQSEIKNLKSPNSEPTSASCETKDLSAQKTLALRLGLRYVRGLRESAAQALLRERSLAPFQSIHDLTRRVPELRKDELTTLAEIGALNSVGSSPQRHRDTEKFGEKSQNNLKICHSERSKESALSRQQHEPVSSNHLQSTIGNLKSSPSSVPLCLCGESSFDSKPETRNSKPVHNSKLTFHRRDALWQIEKAVRRSGPLLEEFPEPDASSPLQQMTYEERLVADFHGTGLTTGPHPMAYRRAEMQALGVHPASSLKSIPSGRRLRIGGCVIARQRPGTAKGFVFLSLEDETGIANAIVHPDLLQKNRILLISGRFLMVEGILQNQDNVISVKAERVLPLNVTNAETSSHDFH
jgi:error-prone DNA polymerase